MESPSTPVAQHETTLVSCSNSPTNQPELLGPQTYVSLRVTIGHDEWEIVETCVYDVSWYISYPHLGKDGNNPHWHVLLPGSDKRDVEKFRKRLKKSGLSGNRQLSVKLCENGVLQGISYCAKERTTPKTRGPVDEWIDKAPRWMNANLGVNLNPKTQSRSKLMRDDSVDGMIPITSRGCMYMVWKYRRDVLVRDGDRKKYTKMADVVLHMLDSLKYYIAPEFARSGLPDFYADVFEESCREGRLTFKKNQKQWWSVLLRPMHRSGFGI